MKIRYFLIGVFVTILTLTIGGYILYKYATNQRNKLLEEVIKEDLNNISISIKNYEDENDLILNSFKKAKSNNYYLESKKIIVINFWATWCAPCIAEMPSFEDLVNSKIFNNEIDFIFASKEESDKVLSFNNKNKFDLPFYTFKTEYKNSIYNHSSIPTTYIIDRQNKLVHIITRSQNWNSKLIKDYINSLIKN